MQPRKTLLFHSFTPRALTSTRLLRADLFPEPFAFNFGTSLVKIPGLDGTGKMGKSEGEGNAIFLADTPEVIRKKVMRAVTDKGPEKENQEKPEIIQNSRMHLRLTFRLKNRNPVHLKFPNMLLEKIIMRSSEKAYTI